MGMISGKVRRGLVILLAAPSLAAGQQLVINEIHYDPPDKTQPLEFVEIYNPGAEPVDLSSYRLTGGIDYTFRSGISIPGQGYILVAEDPRRLEVEYGMPARGPFIGRLDNDGEEIVLRDAAGDVVDRVDYRAEFPWPIGASGRGGSMELVNPALDNNLAGSWRASTLEQATAGGASVVLVPTESPSWRYKKGTEEASSPRGAWREVGFSEDYTWSTGQTSIGYGDDDDHTELNDMRYSYWSVYLRHTFTIPDAGSIPNALRLRSYVDDGCVIWINGHLAAQPYMPSSDPAYNYSGATKHTAAWEELAITVTPGMLNVGENQLAIHVFNTDLYSSDLSIDVELIADSTTLQGGPPSPGAANVQLRANAPPQVRQVNHTPREPTTADPVVITAKVTDPDGVASATAHIQDVLPGSFIPGFLPMDHATLLAYPDRELQVNPDYTNPANWTDLPMVDDGTGGDAVAGDGVYSVQLPARTANRTLVRYMITAEDLLGESVTVPYADDPSLNFATFVYDGVPPYQASVRSVHPEGSGHVYPTNLLTSLPVYHVITRVEDYDDCVAYDSSLQIGGKTHPARDTFNWPGAFVYDGVVYDHVRYRLRQANNRYSGYGRRSFRYRFNRGRYLQARDEHGIKYPTKWRTLNTHKMHVFSSAHTFGLTENANSRLWEIVGVPVPSIHYAHLRMVRNDNEHDQYYGDFQGLTMAQEDYDSRFLNAHGLADGNIYKLKDGQFNGYELRRNQGRDSVVTVADYEYIKSNLTPSLYSYELDEIVRWDKWYLYHVVCEAVRHYDLDPDTTWHKNRAWYFEPRQDTPYGLLWVLPHDSDSSWSRGYHDERLGPGNPNNSVGIDYPRQALFGYKNSLPRPSHTAAYRTAYRGVMRDVRDLLFNEENITNLIAEIVNPIREFSLADRDRWRYAPAEVGYEPDIAIETREQAMYDFAFVSEKWYGTNVVGGRVAVLDMMLNEEEDHVSIPDTPVLLYCGLSNYPVNGLCFSTSAFGDPQGAGTFGAMQWRVGRITDPGAPAYDVTDRPHYEYEANWTSGELTTFTNTIAVPSSALEVGRTYRARVRMKDNTGRWGHWSAPHQFTTTGPDGMNAVLDHLRVTEIMYHPPYSVDDLEFIELYNTSASLTLDLGGVAFTKGIEFAFSDGTSLPPRSVLLVVNDTAMADLAAFRAAYGLDPSVVIVGPYEGGLSNGGEELRLKTASGGAEVLDLTYNDGGDWPDRADGNGSSLEIVDPHDPSADPSNWRPSHHLLGSPGWVPPRYVEKIVINEVLAHTDPPLVDSVELYNPSSQPADLGGWYLSDSTDYRKYSFPSNTVMAPFGYLVVDETDFNPNGEWNTDPGKGPVDTNLHFSFSGAYGDEVHLVEADGGGAVSGFSDSIDFGATPTGESLGRWPNGNGELYPMTGRSLGAANPGPRVGPVVISEIMYHPADTNYASDLEFIEITNTGGADEPLDEWTLSRGVSYAFAPGTILTAGASLVIAGFDPVADPGALAVFQSAYGTVSPVGPWSGQLDNAGETIRLRRPDSPPAEDPMFYPRMEEERIGYNDVAPWPVAADGTGPSLQRLNLGTFGDTPVNWTAHPPTPGTHPASLHHTAWLESHFSAEERGNPAVSGDLADADGDGVSNYDEYIAGTNPRSADDFLCVEILNGPADQPVVSFNSSLVRKYTLEEAVSGLGSDWLPIFSEAQGNGGIIEWVPPGLATDGFYRLRAILPPPGGE